MRRLSGRIRGLQQFDRGLSCALGLAVSIAAFFCLLISITWPKQLGAKETFSASLMKAVYTYKFANFTQWPRAAINQQQENILMCILGDSPFSTAELAQITDKPVKKKNLKTQVFQSGVISPDSLSQCAIAFISQSEQKRLPVLLAAMQQQPILTVSDIDGFDEHGGMITLQQSGQRISFHINLQAIAQSSLQVSSKLLEIARQANNQKQ